MLLAISGSFAIKSAKLYSLAHLHIRRPDGFIEVALKPSLAYF